MVSFFLHVLRTRSTSLFFPACSCPTNNNVFIITLENSMIAVSVLKFDATCTIMHGDIHHNYIIALVTFVILLNSKITPIPKRYTGITFSFPSNGSPSNGPNISRELSRLSTKGFFLVSLQFIPTTRITNAPTAPIPYPS